ncbi:D-alanyl-D-alanine carboxypeptidase/D-alanyl-D-alanine endopeptidase [Litchfieldia alkalitelluris]|uniref:D-alanyl-D-alanine carboxypeptidase/D-alanyl-D-alanine endopeptidase n=1 Tax=Litchfieldia alkalitelluris TaxID=304268 RepID=UPI0009984E57|nr:D-alanyl-D-alanine carboxypeptidase/D-alanyl-D-alanine-endopeptidase [Litchfieldia alkalitelluris]
MKKQWICYTILFVLIVMTVIPVNQHRRDLVTFANGQDQLSKSLNGIIYNQPSLKGSLIGISVREANTGKVVYNHIGDTRLRPASNLKLFTAAAALSALGENHQFKTEIYHDGKIINDTLHGNIYLKGGGDPTLNVEDLDKMADKLLKIGIKKINGDLIGDDTHFDSVRYSHDLPWSDETKYYGSQISALTISPDQDYDAGTVILEIEPGNRETKKAKININPKTDYVTIINNTSTVSNKEHKNIEIFRVHGSNNIVVEGTIPLNQKKYKEWVSVWEPTGLVINLFQKSLSNYNINLRGDIKTGIVPSQAKLLTIHHSMPLSKLLIPFMKLSNNTHGEILVKEMGKKIEGTGEWKKGLKVLNNELTNMKINTDQFVLRDGSGISHVNLITANELTKLLFQVQSMKWFQSYLESLPVSGFNDRLVGGTLRYRLGSPALIGKVRAKTGTITTVSSLSGYVETKNGETLIFSVILNNVLDENSAKDIEDQIVTAIYENN